jgi:hypothetical protein
LSCPLQLCVHSSRVDANIVLFVFDVLVCKVFVDPGGLRKVL